MDNALQLIISLPFLFISLGVAALTFVARKVTEFVLQQPWCPSDKYSKVWTELCMPIMPVVLGACLTALMEDFPYPDNLTSLGSRVFFGLVAGLFSGLFYRLIKSTLQIQKNK